VDRYEYKLKSEQIKKMYEDGDFKTLLNIADSFDWRKINNNVLINIVADAYDKVGKVDEACDLLLMAYDRTSFGRNLAYRLCILSLKLGRIAEAIDFYTDFVRKAPKDPSQFILKYEILKAKKSAPEELIKALESYLLLDIDEKWEFELALLYHKVGQGVKCIEMCNEISLWFSDSEYVTKALELKKEYMPLTDQQERKYNGLHKVVQEEVEEFEGVGEGEGYETFKYQEEEETDNYISEEQAMLMGAVKEVMEFNEENYIDDDMEEISIFEATDEEAMNDEVMNDEELIEEEIIEEQIIEEETAQEETQEIVMEELNEENIDEQIEGQLTLESLLEEYQEREDDAQKKLEQERFERAALIAEKTRILREEIEKQNEIELDGPFGAIFAKEMQEEALFDDDAFLDQDEDEEFQDEFPQEENVDEDLQEDLGDDGEAQEEEKERYGLTPELKNTFERYLPINKMEEQLADTLDSLINYFEEDGTSSTNNIVIMGDEKSGKTSLIIDIIKVVNRERNRTGRKVAKIKGESLNRKGMAATMPKLFGADLIIERAGNLNPETVQDLINVMKDYTEDMIVILEDCEVAIERLFKANSEIVEMFGNTIKIKEIGVKEWVEIAKDYARKSGYIVDEMGTLALHVKIGNVYSRELKLEVNEIEGVIEEAIEKSKKKKRYAKKHRIEGFAVLREADFM